jgi:hypothetical protein
VAVVPAERPTKFNVSNNVEDGAVYLRCLLLSLCPLRLTHAQRLRAGYPG